MADELKLKQIEFNKAMELYDKKVRYKLFGKFISIINVSLQIFLIFLIIPLKLSISSRIISFFIAYLLADFINGLIHMYMDNNDDYNSIWGPLIASFHLHHRNPRYKKNPLHIVYFNESGSKLWLVPLLLLLIISAKLDLLPVFILYTLSLFAVISSLAEVSHYLCHNSTNKLTYFLERIRILMPKKHHGKHHMQDNMNYAFLNGLSDPLINIIAKKLYSGYKEGTDTHYKYYSGAGTTNRDD